MTCKAIIDAQLRPINRRPTRRICSARRRSLKKSAGICSSCTLVEGGQKAVKAGYHFVVDLAFFSSSRQGPCVNHQYLDP